VREFISGLSKSGVNLGGSNIPGLDCGVKLQKGKTGVFSGVRVLDRLGRRVKRKKKEGREEGQRRHRDIKKKNANGIGGMNRTRSAGKRV